MFLVAILACGGTPTYVYTVGKDCAPRSWGHAVNDFESIDEAWSAARDDLAEADPLPSLMTLQICEGNWAPPRSDLQYVPVPVLIEGSGAESTIIDGDLSIDSDLEFDNRRVEPAIEVRQFAVASLLIEAVSILVTDMEVFSLDVSVPMAAGSATITETDLDRLSVVGTGEPLGSPASVAVSYVTIDGGQALESGLWSFKDGLDVEIDTVQISNVVGHEPNDPLIRATDLSAIRVGGSTFQNLDVASVLSIENVPEVEITRVDFESNTTRDAVVSVSAAAFLDMSFSTFVDNVPLSMMYEHGFTEFSFTGSVFSTTLENNGRSVPTDLEFDFGPQAFLLSGLGITYSSSLVDPVPMRFVSDFTTCEVRDVVIPWDFESGAEPLCP